MVVESPNALFARSCAEMRSWRMSGGLRLEGVPELSEALASGQLQVVDAKRARVVARSRRPTRSSRCSGTWSRSRRRGARRPGRLASVDVGILDSGIDGQHPDFVVDSEGSNVDCARGRNSVTFLPSGPGVGTPDPCVDNQFHGTHVAGTVAAQANGIGVVGVAPNVTLVPVKVCDASGYCYASAVVDGITYAGDAKFDVINMSFFVDDDEFQQSPEFKCIDDPVQRAFRSGRASDQYARNRGVTPVAALGNSDKDLAHRAAEPIENNCDVVPAETPGVVGTAALGATARRRPTPTTASGRPTWLHPAATGRQATARRRSCRRCLAGPMAASRAHRWPRRMRPAWRR